MFSGLLVQADLCAQDKERFLKGEIIMNQFKLVLIILFAFMVAVFAVSNPQSASINFFGRTIIPEISMVIVVLGSVLVGVVLTAILGFMIQSKLSREISKLSRNLTHYKDKEEKLQLKIRKLEEKLEEEGLPLPYNRDTREDDH